MNELKLPLVLSSMLLAPAAWTQNVPDGPVADLKAQVTHLANRVSALEAAAPTPSVEGRTYTTAGRYLWRVDDQRNIAGLCAMNFPIHVSMNDGFLRRM